MNKVKISCACYPACYCGHSQQVCQALYRELQAFLTPACWMSLAVALILLHIVAFTKMSSTQ